MLVKPGKLKSGARHVVGGYMYLLLFALVKHGKIKPFTKILNLYVHFVFFYLSTCIVVHILLRFVIKSLIRIPTIR